MEAIDFLRKKYNVPSDKMLSEVLELPRYTWSDVCELLEEYKKEQKKDNLLQSLKIITD